MIMNWSWISMLMNILMRQSFCSWNCWSYKCSGRKCSSKVRKSVTSLFITSSAARSASKLGKRVPGPSILHRAPISAFIWILMYGWRCPRSDSRVHASMQQSRREAKLLFLNLNNGSSQARFYPGSQGFLPPAVSSHVASVWRALSFEPYQCSLCPETSIRYSCPFFRFSNTAQR